MEEKGGPKSRFINPVSGVVFPGTRAQIGRCQMKTDRGVSENKAPKNPCTSSIPGIPGQAGGGSL